MNQNKYKGILASIVLSAIVLLSLVLFMDSMASFASTSQNSQTQPNDITITFWHSYSGDNEVHFTNMIAEFESVYPTITVEVENHYPSVNLFNTVTERIKSGEETPNIVIGYPNQMWNYARFDALRFLDDFAGDPEIGLDLADFHPPSLGDHRLAEYENQLVGLPIRYSPKHAQQEHNRRPPPKLAE